MIRRLIYGRCDITAVIKKLEADTVASLTE